MQALLKLCQSCNKPMNGGVYRASHICPHCAFEHDWGKAQKKARKPQLKAVETEPEMQVEELPVEQAGDTGYEAPETAAEVELTTDAQEQFNVVHAIGEESADCVLKIALTPDLFSDGKFVGAKSEKVQAAIKQGRKHGLAKIREAAFEQGANYVTNIKVKNGIKMAENNAANITVRVTGSLVCVANEVEEV